MGWSSEIVKEQIKQAVQHAMYAWVNPFEDTIDDVSSELAGSYSRPMLLGAGVYNAEIGADYVSITNETPMQGMNYGVAEVDFVEGGYPNYHQPGPRPFMEKSASIFADGKGTSILQGFLDSEVIGD